MLLLLRRQLLLRFYMSIITIFATGAMFVCYSEPFYWRKPLPLSLVFLFFIMTGMWLNNVLNLVVAATSVSVIVCLVVILR